MVYSSLFVYLIAIRRWTSDIDRLVLRGPVAQETLYLVKETHLVFETLHFKKLETMEVD